MKSKILVIALCMFFLVGSVAAFDLSFDNVKDYDQNRQEIIIKNNFGFGKDLVKHELNFNTDFCSRDCYAEGTTTLYEDSNLFSKIDYYDTRNRKVPSSIKIKVGVEETSEVDVDDLNFVCKDGTNQSGDCYYEKVGSHKESVTEIFWRNYYGEILDSGEYHWRIEGTKAPEETVDWIATSFGKKLDEWAYWNSWQDWNDDFEDSPNFNSTFWVNYTDEQGAPPAGVTNFATVNITTLGGDSFAWLRSRVTSGGNTGDNLAVLRTAHDFKDGNDYQILIEMNGSAQEDVQAVEINNGSIVSIATPPSSPPGTIVVNDFRSGDQLNTAKQLYNLTLTADGNATIYNATGSFISSVNVSTLSAWYIQFRNQLSTTTTRTNDIFIYNFTVMGDAVDVELISPVDSFVNTDNNTIFFLGNVSSQNTNLTNVSLFIDGVRNDTTLLNQAEAQVEFEKTFSEGTYVWTYEACNTATCNTASTRSFSVDTSGPLINIIAPNGTINTGVIGDPVDLNWTVSDSSLDMCWFEYPGDVINSLEATAYYDFQSTSGPVIDRVGIQNGTSLFANRGVNGIIGNAFYFNTSGYVTIPTNATSNNFTKNEAYSTSLWVRGNESNSVGTIIEKWQGTAIGYPFSMRQLADGRTQCVVYNNSLSIGSGLTTTSFEDGSWHNVVCTYDHPNKNISIYVDGQVEASNVYTSLEGTIHNNQLIGIGARGNGALKYNGTIDEVAFFNRSLSPDEISFIYNSGVGRAFNNTGLLNKTVECLDNHTTFTQDANQYNLTFYASDTFGNIASSFTSWNYSFISLDESFNTPVLEGSTEDFGLLIQSNQQMSSGKLVYDGVEYSSGFTNLGSFKYSFNRSIVIPSVVSDVNKTFFWNITLASGSQYISNVRTQEVLNLDIGNCSAYSNPLLNYTLFDEDNPGQNISGTIEVDVVLYAEDYETQVGNFSQVISNVNDVCIGTDIATVDASYFMDSKAKYYSTEYSSEYHHIQKANVSSTNIPFNVSLYDLPTNVTTVFEIRLKGQNFLPVAGAIIDISRQYVGEGLFRTVEVPLTDNDGKAVASLRQEDTTYTFFIKKDGEILGSFSNIIPICQNDLTGECNINLNIPSASEAPQDYFKYNNLAYTLNYDEDTRLVSSQFTVLDGTVHTLNLDVELFDRFQNTTICSDSLMSSSGLVSCTIPSTFGNVTALATLTMNSDPNTIAQARINLYDSSRDAFGSTGTIFVILLLLTIPFMFITSLVGMVIGGMVGVILAVLLLLTTGGAGLGITASVIWLIISGAVIIWRLTKGGAGE